MNMTTNKLVPFLLTGSAVGVTAQTTLNKEADKLRETASDVGSKVASEYEALSTRLNELAETPEGRETASSMLEWIDKVEMFHLPWLNWVLVAVGIALFGSHLGQLVMGKLWVGLKTRAFSFVEIANDAFVAGFALLALPVVMMIPTGRDSFIDHPLAVLSAVAAGLILAIILYFHGVRQERLAAYGKAEEKHLKKLDTPA